VNSRVPYNLCGSLKNKIAKDLPMSNVLFIYAGMHEAHKPFVEAIKLLTFREFIESEVFL